MSEIDDVVRIVKGDITKQKVDAIVNAANSDLTPGGGVAGAVHNAAGPQLLEECKRLEGCETGDAKITKGYNLPARYVIHTVGPVWKGGAANEEELLARCYRKSLLLAVTHGLKSVAFPAISTGVFGFPSEKAAAVAARVIKEFVTQDEKLEKIVLVAYDDQSYKNLRENF